MKSFYGKVAAITGASSGIGRSLALLLAEEGCSLSLSDVNEAKLIETKLLAEDRALSYGHAIKVSITKLDVSDREAVFMWAERTAAEHGKVNLIFNNAGVALGATIEGVTFDEFEWIMGINFWGVVNGTKAFLPYLKATGDGHVINTSSVFGFCSQASQGTYNSSKFAVRGFTEALRQELDLMKCGVSSSCVHPGGIKTNIAKDARVSNSVMELLQVSEAVGKEQFEKSFINTPDAAALTILNGVRKDKRRILIGRDAVLIDVVVRLFPSFHQVLVGMLTRHISKTASGGKAVFR